jgi:hypothetical protein
MEEMRVHEMGAMKGNEKEEWKEQPKGIVKEERKDLLMERKWEGKKEIELDFWLAPEWGWMMEMLGSELEKR